MANKEAKLDKAFDSAMEAALFNKYNEIISARSSIFSFKYVLDNKKVISEEDRESYKKGIANLEEKIEFMKKDLEYTYGIDRKD